MKSIRIFIPLICGVLLLGACSKKNYAFRKQVKELKGTWKLVSYGGGFANLPEKATEDDIMVEFTANGKYRNFTEGTLQTETGYGILYTESVITGKKQYMIALEGESPYLNFTVSKNKLRLSGDHPDATYFNYRKIKN